MAAVIFENAKLIALSFILSAALGVVFRMERKYLVWAGVGGALTRIIYLGLEAGTSNVFLRYLLAAMGAALYAEIMAMREKTPSTVFLYPSILPLVPGSMLYYIAAFLMMGYTESGMELIVECIMALFGMCLGFVLISTFTYYRRIYMFGKSVEYHIKDLIKRFFLWLTAGIRGNKGDKEI